MGKILGVTGVIGSGKSVLCRILKEDFGFHWIEADKIVHGLYRPGQSGYQKIKDYFGNQFVGKTGVHRGRLRRFVLKTPQKIWILNKLIHPLLVHEVNKKIVQIKAMEKGKTRHPVCIEAVYFDPKDLGKFIDRLVVVDAPDEQIVKRLSARAVPGSQLGTLLKFQRKNLPKGAEKILNGGSLRSLRKKAASLVVQ